MTRITIQRIISRQLSNPKGLRGKIVAWLMASANREMYDFVLSQSGVVGEDVLEIGFGGGSHFTRLLDKMSGGIVEGIDISESMVRLASQNNKELIDNNRLRLKEANSASIPFNNSEFETVLSLNTIYFWEDPKVDISQIHRVLKPGGRLLLGMNSKKVMLKNAYDNKYFNLYEKEDVMRLLFEAGFKDISHTYKVLRIEDCHLFIAKK